MVYPVGWDPDSLNWTPPVRLEAQGGELVAHGFSGQRIAIPAGEIGAVKVVSRTGRGAGRGPSLVVLDAGGRLLMRAGGIWDERTARGRGRRGQKAGMALRGLCEVLDIAYPGYLPAAAARQEVPRWRKAPGYRRLRTRPDGLLVSRPAWVLLALVLGALSITAGVLITLALSGPIGTVDDLIGMLLVTGGVWAAGWLVVMARRAPDWARESLERGTPAPLDVFTGPSPKLRAVAGVFLTVVMILAIPAVIAFGPVVGLVSLAHGLSDQALVAALRQHGATAAGNIWVDTEFTGDDEGMTEETHTTWLEFQAPGGQYVITPDPAIGGRTWPVSSPAGLATAEIVYLPAHPGTAAVAGQLAVSPWRGTPAGNLISGALLTAALVPLCAATIRRVRRATGMPSSGDPEPA